MTEPRELLGRAHHPTPWQPAIAGVQYEHAAHRAGHRVAPGRSRVDTGRGDGRELERRGAALGGVVHQTRAPGPESDRRGIRGCGGEKQGNRGVGGVPYQVLSVFLTYTAIVMTYVPFLLAEIDSQSTAEALIVVIPIAYAVPFLAGFENVIGILIIGFALYQAWKMTVKREIVWGGPFQVGTDSSG